MSSIVRCTIFRTTKKRNFTFNTRLSHVEFLNMSVLKKSLIYLDMDVWEYITFVLTQGGKSKQNEFPSEESQLLIQHH